MACYTVNGLHSLEHTLSTLLEKVPLPVTAEDCIIEQAIGRVLAQPIYAPTALPEYHLSAMDGYGIKHTEHVVNTQFHLCGQSLAGQPKRGAVQQGECVYITTGAVLPEGVDTVIMQEYAQKKDNIITFDQQPKIFENVRLAGNIISQGDIVFAQGYPLKAVDLAILTTLGLEQVLVYQPITVALFSTGDELKIPPESLALGQIYESNRVMLKTLLQKLQVNVIDLGIIPDDFKQLTQAFNKADQQADLVISSGGVSVGAADYTKQVLDELGEVGLWKVAIKPGKPFAFGELSQSLFMGLPGNPVSALVTFQQLVLPAIYRFQGRKIPQKQQLQAYTTQPLQKRPGRKDFQRAWVDFSTSPLQVTPMPSQDSANLFSLAAANCYIVLDADSGNVALSQEVSIELFDTIFND